MIIVTCPKCGSDLSCLAYATNPPINAWVCSKCNWSYEEKEKIKRIPFVLEKMESKQNNMNAERKGGEVGMKTNKYLIAEYDDLEMPSDDMDTDIKNWRSHLVKVRKDTKCAYCEAPIGKGDFALSERGFCDGEPFLIHDCIDCADDLITFHKGEIDSEEYYRRWETRHKKYAGLDGR